MQAQRTTPADMQCNDKFLIQSTIVPHEKMEDTIISEMFMKYKAKYIHENKLKVLLISPPESPVWQPVNGVLKEYFPDNSSTLNEKLQIGVENLPPPHEVTEMMGLVIIQPLDLKFTFELRKQSSCSVTLTNTTAQCVAFKVKTTPPKKYCIRPNIGIIKPNSTINLIVTMQAQRTTPADMQCKDKFLIQSTIVPHEKMEVREG
ncbi:unnamed protein product [Cuscuta epithymum]|uniref:MSP domain-containing protein n=1 Tax=Cuscuta epithymum TaxID=186058 RepID=A0AAV0F2V4_9ASTE|nr:unnamed protein product [Cuscuta epithymum]CAH9129841.1 unnamed protein product [Cuscuta epithymum]